MRNKKESRIDVLRRQRLESQIADVRSELCFRKATRDAARGARARPMGPSGSDETEDQATDTDPDLWHKLARDNLDHATDDNLQKAWKHVHRAKRLLYESYDDNERQDRAKALRLEALEKLGGWRKDAVKEVLPVAACTSEVTPGALVLAQFILDEHFENVYFKLDMLSARLRGATSLLTGLVAGLVLVAVGFDRLGRPLDGIFSLTTLIPVLLLGATGAGLSILLSLGQLGGRIPEVLKGGWESAVRPLLGALSAVVFLAILQAGLFAFPTPEDSHIWAYAILAGFSDQIVVRTIAAAEKAVTK